MRGRVEPTSVLLVLGGPAALGAALGMRFGPAVLLERSLALPAVWLTVGALMLPPLYVGCAMLRLAVGPWRIAAALARGLRAAGIALLGLAPALAFLLATASTDLPVIVLGGLAVLGAAAVAVRAVFLGVAGDAGVSGPGADPGDVPEMSLAGALFFAAWALVAIGLGGVLFLRHVVA